MKKFYIGTTWHKFILNSYNQISTYSENSSFVITEKGKTILSCKSDNVSLLYAYCSKFITSLTVS